MFSGSPSDDALAEIEERVASRRAQWQGPSTASQGSGVQVTDRQIAEIHKRLIDNDKYHLLQSEARHCLFVGKSRSGKSTVVSALQDPVYEPPPMHAGVGTLEPVVHSFTVTQPAAGGASGPVNLTVVDTPGLFEAVTGGNDTRDNEALIDSITLCVQNAVTQVHAVVMFISVAQAVAVEDVRAIERFVLMFGVASEAEADQRRAQLTQSKQRVLDLAEQLKQAEQATVEPKRANEAAWKEAARVAGQAATAEQQAEKYHKAAFSDDGTARKEAMRALERAREAAAVVDRLRNDLDAAKAEVAQNTPLQMVLCVTRADLLGDTQRVSIERQLRSYATLSALMTANSMSVLFMGAVQASVEGRYGTKDQLIAVYKDMSELREKFFATLFGQNVEAKPLMALAGFRGKAAQLAARLAAATQSFKTLAGAGVDAVNGTAVQEHVESMESLKLQLQFLSAPQFGTALSELTEAATKFNTSRGDVARARREFLLGGTWYGRVAPHPDDLLEDAREADQAKPV